MESSPNFDKSFYDTNNYRGTMYSIAKYTFVAKNERGWLAKKVHTKRNISFFVLILSQEKFEKHLSLSLLLIKNIVI